MNRLMTAGLLGFVISTLGFADVRMLGALIYSGDSDQEVVSALTQLEDQMNNLMNNGYQVLGSIQSTSAKVLTQVDNSSTSRYDSIGAEEGLLTYYYTTLIKEESFSTPVLGTSGAPQLIHLVNWSYRYQQVGLDWAPDSRYQSEYQAFLSQIEEHMGQGYVLKDPVQVNIGSARKDSRRGFDGYKAQNYVIMDYTATLTLDPSKQ